MPRSVTGGAFLNGTDMEQIKEARKSRGFTQSELAEASGLSKPYISMVEAGKKSPTVRTLWRIADALGVDLEVKFRNREGCHPKLKV